MAALPGTYCRALVIYGNDDSGSDPFVNILWFNMAGVAADWQAAAEDLAAALDTAISPVAINCLAADARYIAVKVEMAVAAVSYTAANNANAQVGQVLGDSCPDYVAAVIRKKTARGGRTGRGRWFMPCVPEAFTNTSALTPGAVTSYGLLADTYVDTYVAGGVTFVAAHWSPTDLVFEPLTGYLVAPLLQTQRGRLLRPPF